MDSVIQIGTLVLIILGTLINLYFFTQQKYHFGRERHYWENRSLHDAIVYLNSHRKELEHVLSIEGKPLKDWTEQDYECANVICFDLFHIGALVESGSVPDEFCRMYYYTIPKTRQILDEYIEHTRKKRHPKYWTKFDYIVKRTRELNAGTEFEVRL